MPTCTRCGNSTGLLDLRNGICSTCRKQESDDLKQIAQARKDATSRAAQAISVTTIAMPPFGIRFDMLGIIGSQASYGMNIFKDISVAVRDAVGGRSKAVEDFIAKAREICISELREKALLLGATDIIAVQFTYSEIGSTGGAMILVTATGTAIRVHS